MARLRFFDCCRCFCFSRVCSPERTGAPAAAHCCRSSSSCATQRANVFKPRELRFCLQLCSTRMHQQLLLLRLCCHLPLILILLFTVSCHIRATGADALLLASLSSPLLLQETHPTHSSNVVAAPRWSGGSSTLRALPLRSAFSSLKAQIPSCLSAGQAAAVDQSADFRRPCHSPAPDARTGDAPPAVLRATSARSLLAASGGRGAAAAAADTLLASAVACGSGAAVAGRPVAARCNPASRVGVAAATRPGAARAAGPPAGSAALLLLLTPHVAAFVNVYSPSSSRASGPPFSRTAPTTTTGAETATTTAAAAALPATTESRRGTATAPAAAAPPAAVMGAAAATAAAHGFGFGAAARPSAADTGVPSFLSLSFVLQCPAASGRGHLLQQGARSSSCSTAAAAASPTRHSGVNGEVCSQRGPTLHPLQPNKNRETAHAAEAAESWGTAAGRDTAYKGEGERTGKSDAYSTTSLAAAAAPVVGEVTETCGSANGQQQGEQPHLEEEQQSEKQQLQEEKKQQLQEDTQQQLHEQQQPQEEKKQERQRSSGAEEGSLSANAPVATRGSSRLRQTSAAAASSSLLRSEAGESSAAEGEGFHMDREQQQERKWRDRSGRRLQQYRRRGPEQRFFSSTGGFPRRSANHEAEDDAAEEYDGGSPEEYDEQDREEEPPLRRGRGREVTYQYFRSSSSSRSSTGEQGYYSNADDGAPDFFSSSSRSGSSRSSRGGGRFQSSSWEGRGRPPRRVFEPARASYFDGSFDSSRQQQQPEQRVPQPHAQQQHPWQQPQQHRKALQQRDTSPGSSSQEQEGRKDMQQQQAGGGGWSAGQHREDPRKIESEGDTYLRDDDNGFQRDALPRRTAAGRRFAAAANRFAALRRRPYGYWMPSEGEQQGSSRGSSRGSSSDDEEFPASEQGSGTAPEGRGARTQAQQVQQQQERRHADALEQTELSSSSRRRSPAGAAAAAARRRTLWVGAEAAAELRSPMYRVGGGRYRRRGALGRRRVGLFSQSQKDVTLPLSLPLVLRSLDVGLLLCSDRGAATAAAAPAAAQAAAASGATAEVTQAATASEPSPAAAGVTAAETAREKTETREGLSAALCELMEQQLPILIDEDQLCDMIDDRMRRRLLLQSAPHDLPGEEQQQPVQQQQQEQQEEAADVEESATSLAGEKDVAAPAASIGAYAAAVRAVPLGSLLGLSENSGSRPWFSFAAQYQEARQLFHKDEEKLQQLEAQAALVRRALEARKKRKQTLDAALQRHGLSLNPSSWMARAFVYFNRFQLRNVVFTLWKDHVLRSFYRAAAAAAPAAAAPAAGGAAPQGAATEVFAKAGGGTGGRQSAGGEADGHTGAEKEEREQQHQEPSSTATAAETNTSVGDAAAPSNGEKKPTSPQATEPLQDNQTRGVPKSSCSEEENLAAEATIAPAAVSSVSEQLAEDFEAAAGPVVGIADDWRNYVQRVYGIDIEKQPMLEVPLLLAKHVFLTQRYAAFVRSQQQYKFRFVSQRRWTDEQQQQQAISEDMRQPQQSPDEQPEGQQPNSEEELEQQSQPQSLQQQPEEQHRSEERQQPQQQPRRRRSRLSGEQEQPRKAQQPEEPQVLQSSSQEREGGSSSTSQQESEQEQHGQEEQQS